MSGQKWYVSHAEALTQNIAGLLIAFVVMMSLKIPLHTTLQIQVILFFTSYIRSYTIRRIFNWLSLRK